MNFIGKILPVEGYYVLLDASLPIDYAKSLTHLYQPLIGIQATALYQTLLHERELQNDSTLQTHHTLMNYLNLPLDEIYQSRLLLEGIGLLETYKENTTAKNRYTYVLKAPFSPGAFLKDAMLTQLLYHHIGEDKFSVLKSRYAKPTGFTLGENITATFSDVFQTFTPSLEQVEVVPAQSNKTANENDNKVDFSWMEQMLKQRMIPVKKVLTADNKKLISQMLLLYDLAPFEIEKSVLWALTDENELDQEEFQTACHDLFKSKHDDTPIQLVKKVQKPSKQTSEMPVTKEEMLIQELETISPKQLLEDLSSGGQASERDMKVIRQVMTSQGLPSPVMNVLIHYVLLQSDMKLSKAYLETLASHWSRANLKTAKEAMTFAKKERNRYQQSAAKKSTYNKPGSKEVVPDWFKERNNKKPKPAKYTDTAMTKEQEKIAALLRQYSSNN
jgi:replication initiation and membrane attachment protein